ncbi:MAG: diaminopimelate epimerase [Eggerthellaceae bacterium]|nr:diaminopimelate epimerase [Eggerthellaceae bacterium]
MELSFAKLHGLGNDFVFVDDFSREIELTTDQVKWLCDRHFGIGADGVILVRPSSHAECAAYMHYINSDGSLAQMCGNGVRCFAKYLVDRGFVNASDGSFVADTLAGPRPISFEVDDEERLARATVDMGHPILDPTDVPVDAEPTGMSAQGVPYAKEVPLDSPWGTFAFTCVSMGNPHAICFIDDWESVSDELFGDPAHKSLDALDLDAVGAFFECNAAFPEKTNVEFAVVEDDGIHMRVFERGCGETLACGTGACATNVAAALTGRASRENDLVLRGGTLHIVWGDDDHVMMTGAAAESFSGTVIVPEA